MYGKKLHIVLLVFFLSFLALPSGAQESVGLFNSPKGFGAQVRFPENDGIFHSALVFVDIYGVPTSRCSNPGIRVNASRNYILSRRQKGEIGMSFYAGPGVTLGYLRDHDKGRGIDMESLFGKPSPLTKRLAEVKEALEKEAPSTNMSLPQPSMSSAPEKASDRAMVMALFHSTFHSPQT